MVLSPFDDYPVHQTALPVAHAATGDPNHYDRYWFNGYREDCYFAIGMAVYPNRGIIDAAFATVHDGVQRSVFASGRLPVDRSVTRVGPIRIDIVEPLRVTRVRVDAADLGIDADVTFAARTVAIEEPRQTLTRGTQLLMDSTRLTQWGTWSGSIATGGAALELDPAAPWYGTKDRSWGVRPVGPQVDAAPTAQLPEVFFLWAPLNFADRCSHFLCFERPDGTRFVGTQALLDVVGGEVPTWGPEAEARIEHLVTTAVDLEWEPGLRRSRRASLSMRRHDGGEERFDLEPLLTFRMRGIGYTHPQWGHGTWHGEEAVGSEEHAVGDLDDLEPWNVHVQQVVRARWGDREGLGVLEQIAFGAHAPTGLTGFLDGYEPGSTGTR